jgi:glycosyltransferase involved in cell wall biosynthesis
VAARFQDVRIVWHVHYGKLVGTSSVLPYRIASHGISGVIAVSDVLAAWSRYHLHVPAGRVWYVPNFAELPSAAVCPDLPGRKGFRIAHVANLRPEKDHPTLLQAFAVVASALPDAHLLLAGGAPDLNYRNSLIRLIDTLGLGGRVTMLGSRTDISDVLAQCDVGVLSSISEGLPVSLIEYGVAGLAAVATTVGQSSEVLDGGTAGVLVPSGDTAALAEAILSLLQSPARRSELGRRLHERVKSRYSPQAVIGQISDIYETVLRN